MTKLNVTLVVHKHHKWRFCSF